MNRTRFLALLAALLVTFAPGLAMAAEWKDGYTPSNGVAPGSSGMGGWDGASFRVFRSDASGILRTTEEYPMTSATANPFPAANAVPVTTSLQMIGNGWSAYPYGNRSLYFKRTVASGTGADPMYLYLYASDDNVSFYPVINPQAFSTTTFAAIDTAKVDTCMVRIPSSPVTFEAIFSFPIETYGYMGKYLAIYAKRDGSVVQNLTLVWMGRQK